MRNPRTRIVTFRLSEEEYEGLIELADAEGARSVSETARDAIRARINRRLQIRTGEDALGLADLRRGIKTLNGEIDQIARKLLAVETTARPEAEKPLAAVRKQAS